MTDIPLFEDGVAEIPKFPGTDKPPPSSHELHCEVCGKELSYSGKGRKPKYCDEHKRSSSSSSNTGTKKNSNAQLAAQAADALVSVNSLVVMGLMFAQFGDTASEISKREDAFREQAYQALLTDPALCKSILRAGQTSGKISLLIAYGMLGASVAPTAMVEVNEKRDARAKAREEKESGNGEGWAA